MKKIFLLLSIFYFFVSCENKVNTVHHSMNVYFNNQLNESINLEVFRGENLLTFNLTANDTIFFTTIKYVEVEGVKTNLALEDVAYDSFLSSIDSFNVFYNNKKYTYDNIFIEEYRHPCFQIESYSDNNGFIIFNEEKKRNLRWE